jgi:hypothetical protein
MNISKVKAAWAFLTGGWSGLAQYLLGLVNKALALCDAEKCRKCATIAISIAAIVKTAVAVFAPEKYRDPAGKTVEALGVVAAALEDGKLTEEELNANIDNIAKCIEAWKAVA